MKKACLFVLSFCLLGTVALANSVILLSQDELVSSADAVILGRVASIQCSPDERGNIQTFIEVSVQRDFLNQLPTGSTAFLKESGGSFDGIAQWGFGTAELQVGEGVVLFATLQPDGFFRIAHLFQGKFGVDPSGALRQELPDETGVTQRNVRRFSRLEEIETATASARPRPLGRYARDLSLPYSEPLSSFSLRGILAQKSVAGDTTSAQFATASNPSIGTARWHEFEIGRTVSLFVNPLNAPGGASNGITAVNSAIQAWDTVAGTRIALANGGQTGLFGYNFNDNTNVISYGDPQNLMTAPVNCAGTLAITYSTWGSTTDVVNGRSFYRLLQADIIFNKGFDCFLSIPSNLAEVTAHETGHAIGLLHSSNSSSETNPVLLDALMYYLAHGDGRGASVRTNDINAIQFIYPGTTSGSSVQISGLNASPFVISPNGDGISDVLNAQFTLSGTDSITVEILDRNGAVVATPLSNSSRNSGTQIVAWNGYTPAGVVANDGEYTVRVRGASAPAVQAAFGVNNTVPEVSKTWFLAEGSTVGFSAYALIQNPNSSPVTVRLTFFKQDGTTQTYSETVPALTRTTVAIHGQVPNTFSVSTRVDATLPILVERAMYFNNGNAGHDSIGEVATSRSWYFPANHTFAGDEDFILIVNPSTSATSVTATFLLENQSPVIQTYSVGPQSRYTIPVHGILQGTRVSVQLQCSLPVAAERSFYINNRTGGTAGIGAVSPALSWYFAEGDTSAMTSPSPATTIIEVMNPSTSAATVTVNFMLENGSVIAKNYTVGAQRRLPIDAATEIGSGLRFSAAVFSTVPIVAESLLFSGADVGGSIGSPTTAYVWDLAEGFTAYGYETWVLISNPGTQTANITVRFQQQNGQNVVQSYTLGPKQRLTIYVNNFIPSTSVSTQVSSDQPIVVERTMKFASRQGVHRSLGARQ